MDCITLFPLELSSTDFTHVFGGGDMFVHMLPKTCSVPKGFRAGLTRMWPFGNLAFAVLPHMSIQI